MTREEQIKQKASEFAYSISSIRPELNKDSFITGAKWADKTMIDKICSLIEENIDYACLHLGNYMEKEVDAKELSEWIRNLWNTNAR